MHFTALRGRGRGIERLYGKRPIQCLASSKILTPHPLTARRVCTHPPLVRREDTLAGWRGGWGVNILEDARHSSVLYICKYFVGRGLSSTLCVKRPLSQRRPVYHIWYPTQEYSIADWWKSDFSRGCTQRFPHYPSQMPNPNSTLLAEMWPFLAEKLAFQMKRYLFRVHTFY